MTGWNEKILDIDLTTGSIRTYPLDMTMARLFVGGRGLGARLLWDLVSPEVDPLSPDNVLIFTNGPLTGTAYQTSNRFSVSTKSPLTGTILDANSGGFWGMQFKKTGHDAMIIRGKAEKPVWIEIKNDLVTIQDAETGEVLMLAYMNAESLARTLETGKTWFWSRSRQKFWMKGETSGHRLAVKQIATDCDRDTVLVRVEPLGPGVCHEGYQSCFYRTLRDGQWVVSEERSYDPGRSYGGGK